MAFTDTSKGPLPRPLAERAYLGVYTYTTPEGQVLPRRVRWHDGQEWEIDRVLDVRPGVARKAGGVGTRYLVRIGRHERELFLVDGRWFSQVDAQERRE